MDPPALSPQTIDALYEAAQLAVLTSARPFGLALIFAPLAWGQINSGLLRLVFAVVLGLPVLEFLWSDPEASLKHLPAPILVMIGKEVLIGLLIGAFSSAVFQSALVGGAIIDAYRGAGSGFSTPAGEATADGQLFMGVTLWIFASIGGFWSMADLVYSSYRTWPLLELLPLPTLAGIPAFLRFVEALARLAFVLAAPILFLMLASDMVFLVAARLSRQLQIASLSFTVKNLIATFAMPFFAYVFVRVMTGEVRGFASIEHLLSAALK